MHFKKATSLFVLSNLFVFAFAAPASSSDPSSLLPNAAPAVDARVESRATPITRKKSSIKSIDPKNPLLLIPNTLYITAYRLQVGANIGYHHYGLLYHGGDNENVAWEWGVDKQDDLNLDGMIIDKSRIKPFKGSRRDNYVVVTNCGAGFSDIIDTKKTNLDVIMEVGPGLKDFTMSLRSLTKDLDTKDPEQSQDMVNKIIAALQKSKAVNVMAQDFATKSAMWVRMDSMVRSNIAKGETLIYEVN